MTLTEPILVRRWPAVVSAILLLLTGLGLGLPGAYLLTLGGSAYYLITGVIMIVCAVLYWRQKRTGFWLYLVFLAATIIWALSEVGLDGWALMPRLVYFVVGGLWLATPLVRNSAAL